MRNRVQIRNSTTSPTVDHHFGPAAVLVARFMWIVFTAGLLLPLVSGLAMAYSQAQTPCQGSNCDIGQITTGNVIALHRLSIPVSLYVLYPFIFSLAVSAILFLVSFVLFWRRSDQWFAFFVSLWLLVGAAVPWVSPAVTLFPPPIMTIIADGLVMALFLGLGVFAVTFPNGQLDPRWSWLIPLLWTLQLLAFLAPPPLNISDWPGPSFPLEVVVVFGSTLVVAVYRYTRRYTAVEREQTKWFVYGLAMSVAYVLCYFVLMGLLPPDSPALLLLLPTQLILAFCVSLSIGIALLRYRLFDIDVLISRTVVYAALTAVVVGLYVLIVGYLGTVFHTEGNLAISLVATGAVAVLFQPLRSWLQRGINRLLYGERDDPYHVLARLDRQLAVAVPPEEVLPAMVSAIATTLKLPYVAIGLVQDGEQSENEEVVATYGSTANPVEGLPLVYRGDITGHLVVAPRPGEPQLSSVDTRLLKDLAQHAGVVAHSVHLMIDLRRSRERIVLAREEERRRLRRDLHDGLGPMLASLTLTLAAAREYLPHDPMTADGLLGALATHVQGAVSDIRRLVYELRPPALDDLGLVGALRDQAVRSAQGGLRVEVEAPFTVDPLPAAVEVAAYRIGVEALTNVVRHAQASICTIGVRRDGDLILEISDDGQGLPAETPRGIGLRSMRERAEELGGSCLVASKSTGGTLVAVRLPLAKEREGSNGTVD